MQKIIAVFGVFLFLTLTVSNLSADTITFAGNMTLGSNSHLNIGISGTTQGSEYDNLIVNGNLTLNGTLVVVFENGYIPFGGEEFDILDFLPEKLTGSFSAYDLAVLPGELEWNLSRLYTDGIIAVVVPCVLTADFTGDCVVDLADYAVFAAAWQSEAGTSGWNGICDISDPADNVIDIADLQVFMEQWLMEE